MRTVPPTIYSNGYTATGVTSGGYIILSCYVGAVRRMVTTTMLAVPVGSALAQVTEPNQTLPCFLCSSVDWLLPFDTLKPITKNFFVNCQFMVKYLHKTAQTIEISTVYTTFIRIK